MENKNDIENENEKNYDKLKYLIPIPWVIMTGIVTTTEYNKFITNCYINNEISRKTDTTSSLCFIASFTEFIILVGFISLSCATVINVAILTKKKIVNYYKNFEL